MATTTTPARVLDHRVAPRRTAAAPVDDAAIAKLAATAELLAIDFYTRGIDSGLFTADVLGYTPPSPR